MRGGVRSGAGRKRGTAKENTRNIVKQIRWTSEEWKKVESAAQTTLQTPSEFVRSATLAKTYQNIGESMIYNTDLAFGVAGKCWAAINAQNEVVEIVKMDDIPYIGKYSAEAKALAKKSKACKATERAAEMISRELFLAHRKRTKDRLSQLGRVVSGVASCGEFIPNDEYDGG